jgi:hypothetical protein
LNDEAIGPELRGRNLESLVGVSRTGEPITERRYETDFFVRCHGFIEQNNDVLGFQGGM